MLSKFIKNNTIPQTPQTDTTNPLKYNQQKKERVAARHKLLKFTAILVRFIHKIITNQRDSVMKKIYWQEYLNFLFFNYPKITTPQTLGSIAPRPPATTRIPLPARTLINFFGIKKVRGSKLKNSNIFSAWSRIKNNIRHLTRLKQRKKIKKHSSMFSNFILFYVKTKQHRNKFGTFVKPSTKSRIKNQIIKSKKIYMQHIKRVNVKLTPANFIKQKNQRLVMLNIHILKLKQKYTKKTHKNTLTMPRKPKTFIWNWNNKTTTHQCHKYTLLTIKSTTKHFVVHVKYNNPICLNTSATPARLINKHIIRLSTIKSLVSWTKVIRHRTPPQSTPNTLTKIFKNLFYFYIGSTQERLSNYFCHPKILHNNHNVGLLNIILPQQIAVNATTQNDIQRFRNFINFNVTLKNNKKEIALTNFYPLITLKYINPIMAYNQHINYINIGVINATNFYNHFLITFLEKYLNQQIWIRYDARNHSNFSVISKKRLLNYLKLVESNLFSVHVNRLVPIYELVDIILIMFTTRDLQIFLHFVKGCLERAHFKKHKKILFIIFDTLKKYESAMHQTAIRGFFFDIRGKVGVSGNAKKRHILFSIGKINTTSQNFRSQWQQINIWTPTGQMGITCYILY